MKALVTGGTGFLGGALVRRLRARGDAVRSFNRGTNPALDTLGVEQIQGDLADLEALTNAAAGCDLVFHVAAKAGVWGPYVDYHRANVVGTENVLKACRRNYIQRLVYTSTPSVVHGGGDVDGVDETAPYATSFETAYPATKAIAERLVIAANGPDLATVALRPHLIWGPGDNHLLPRLLERARAGRLRRIGRESKLVDTVYIDNAVDAHLLAADRLTPGAPITGKVFFITNGEPVPLWDFINRLLAAADLPPVTKSLSPALAYWAGLLCEVAYRSCRWSGEPPLTRFVVRQLSTAHWYCIDAARRELGYEPRVSLTEGLHRLAHSLKGSHGDIQPTSRAGAL